MQKLAITSDTERIVQKLAITSASEDALSVETCGSAQDAVPALSGAFP